MPDAKNLEAMNQEQTEGNVVAGCRRPSSSLSSQERGLVWNEKYGIGLYFVFVC